MVRGIAYEFFRQLINGSLERLPSELLGASHFASHADFAAMRLKQFEFGSCVLPLFYVLNPMDCR